METITGDLEQSYSRLLAAGDFAAKKMGSLWDRNSRRWLNRELGVMLHDLATAQASALFLIDDAQYSYAAGDYAQANIFLEKASVELKAQGRTVSEQMKRYWDSETKTWTDAELGVFFHDLLNLQAKAMNSVRFAHREVRKLVS